MADYLPQISSNWTTATWITAFSNLTAFAGIPPMSADDVFADGKTITIDTNIHVATLRTTTAPRTGGLAGGGFRATHNTSLTANLLAGTTTVLTFASAAPNFCTCVGNLTSNTAGIQCIRNESTGTFNSRGSIFTTVGSFTSYTIANVAGGTLNFVGNVNNGLGIKNDASGTINIVGDVYGGLDQDQMGINPQTGVVNITGNLFGRSGNSSAAAFMNATGTLNVLGNVVGGTGVAQSGIQLEGGTNATISITGNVIGGIGTSRGINVAAAATTPIITIVGNVSGRAGIGLDVATSRATINIFGNAVGSNTASVVGINNASTGTINIFGNAIGSTGSGINNAAAGLVYIKRVIGAPGGPTNPTGGTAAGLSNSQNGLAYVEEIAFGDQGASPVSGPAFLVNRPNTVLVMEGPPPTFTSTTLFGNLNVPNLFPSVSSVRSGITYGNGDFTGTMVVPPRESVQIGVPVDNTVGTFVLSPESFWTFKRSNSAINDPTTIGYRIKNLATIPSVGSLIGSFNVATISGYSI